MEKLNELMRLALTGDVDAVNEALQSIWFLIYFAERYGACAMKKPRYKPEGNIVFSEEQLVKVNDHVYEVQRDFSILEMKVIFAGDLDMPYCLATFGGADVDGCHKLNGYNYGITWAKTKEEAEKCAERLALEYGSRSAWKD